MSENPYRPPEARLTDAADAPAGTHLGWKIFFWIALVLIVAGTASVPFVSAMTAFDWIDVASSIVALAGLGGLAFQQGLGARRFWVGFFVFSVLWTLFYALGLPLLGVPVYGQVLAFGVAFAISLAFSGGMLFALYVYALRAPHLWR